MSALGELRLVVLTAASLGFVASLLGSVVAWAVLCWTKAWGAATRRRVLVLAGVAPLLVAVVTFVAALLPAFQAYLDPGADHCLHHDDGHAHLCFVHWPLGAGGLTGWLVALGLIAWGAARLASGLAALWRASRLVRVLREQASPAPDGRTWSLPVDQPLGLTLGLWRPWILLSRGMRERIPASLLAVIVAHEEAHARARDTLVQLLVRGCSWVLWPSVREQLLDELALAAEQAADNHAALVVGDRLLVAEAIVAAEKLMARGSSPLPLLAVSFGPHHTTRRVEALLAEPLSGRSLHSALLVMVAALVVPLVAHDHIHHLTESVLGLLP